MVSLCYKKIMGFPIANVNIVTVTLLIISVMFYQLIHIGFKVEELYYYSIMRIVLISS